MSKADTPKKLEDLLSGKLRDSLKDGEEILETKQKAEKALYTHEYMRDEPGFMKDLQHAHESHHGAYERLHRGGDPTQEPQASGVPAAGGAKLDKRVRRRQLVQEALLKSFAEQLNIIFDRILGAAEELAPVSELVKFLCPILWKNSPGHLQFCLTSRRNMYTIHLPVTITMFALAKRGRDSLALVVM